jgi:Acetyltransferase (GNAT) domain
MLKSINTKEEWKSALSQLEYDWYHTWDYHQMAKSNGEGDPVLLVFESGEQKICFPLLTRSIDSQWKDATSVYGYPGPISAIEISQGDLQLFLEKLALWASENRIVSVFSRLNTCIDGKNKELNQVSEKKGETVTIDLRLSLDEQRKNYRKNYRNLLNKLVKDGFSCTWGSSMSDVLEFESIYNKTMDALGASDNYYFDTQYYESLLNAQDFETRIYSCYQNGEKTCSGIFVFCGDIVQYHLSGTVLKFKNSAPTRLMLDTVRIDASELGYKTFHLGGGISGIRDSLFNFKYGFSKNAIEFRVLKLVTNRKAYAQLSGIEESEIDKNIEDFFPLYRQKNM